jgi:hypothetical protein
VQIVEWYDELARLTDGPRAGLAGLAVLDDSLPRYAAVAA